MNYVFDACALIALLNEEPGKEIVTDLLKKAADKEITVYMSAVNLVEVFYGYIRDLGIPGARLVIEKVNRLPIIIVDVISSLVISEASRLKGTYKMSTADAVGLATALELSAVSLPLDGKMYISVITRIEVLAYPYMKAEEETAKANRTFGIHLGLRHPPGADGNAHSRFVLYRYPRFRSLVVQGLPVYLVLPRFPSGGPGGYFHAACHRFPAGKGVFRFGRIVQGKGKTPLYPRQGGSGSNRSQLSPAGRYGQDGPVCPPGADYHGLFAEVVVYRHPRFRTRGVHRLLFYA